MISFNSCAQKKELVEKTNYSKSKIDSLLINYFPTDQPGGTILVSKGSEIIFSKSFGKANLERGTNMQLENSFVIASLTKPFTAIAIMKLIEEGRVKLEDKVSDYIENFPEAGEAISIGNLLSHTSGMEFKNDEKERIRLKEAISKNRKDESISIVDYFASDKFDHPPGKRYDYNNVSYYLLGFIIEKLSGLKYGEYLEQHFFKPLNMNNSEIGSASNPLKSQVTGYDSFNGDQYQRSNIDAEDFYYYSAGGVVSNVKDLQIWYEALFSYKIVSKEILENVINPITYSDGTIGNNGYGLYIGNLNGHKYLYHDGLDWGYGSIALYFPDSQILIVHLRNCGYCQYDIGKSYGLPVKIASILLDSEFLHVSSPNSSQFEGLYKSENKSILKEIISKNNGLFINSKYGELPLKRIENNTFFVERTNETIQFSEINGKLKLFSTISVKQEFIKEE